MIIRTEYLKLLETFKDNKSIKVITGVRRCGKSFLLLQFIDLLRKKYRIDKSQIITYDFNNLELKKIKYEKLYKEILKKAQKNKANYVFLDEIQEIKKFEECVNSLHANREIKFDIYLTGSNSHMFSKKLATLFTGRDIEIKMYPLSFKEYYGYISNAYKTNNKREIFNNYLKYGGLPIYIEFYNDEKNIEAKLSSVINDSLEKDILQRHKILNPSDFNRLFRYIFDHIGQDISTKNISHTIKSKNHNVISPKTIDRYIDWIAESLLIYRCYFYTLIGKKTLDTAGKIYSVDVGIRNALRHFEVNNRGSLLENIVYIELLRRGYEVNALKMNNGKQIDFIAIKGGIKQYYQVTEHISVEEVKEREIGNLRNIKDSHEKITLVLLEEGSSITEDGIKIINIIDWLLE